MAKNLFVSYDLRSPGQNYHKIIEAIKSLGAWAKVQDSLWYVSSQSNAETAAKHIRLAMDANDSLIVINLTDNDAYWFNLSNEVTAHVKNHWRL